MASGPTMELFVSLQVMTGGPACCPSRIAAGRTVRLLPRPVHVMNCGAYGNRCGASHHAWRNVFPA